MSYPTRDDNGFPLYYGVSDLDGITPVQIQFDTTTTPGTTVMLVDATTTISFTPATLGTNQNPNTITPFLKATSSADNTTVLPLVVNHSTGAILVS